MSNTNVPTSYSHALQILNGRNNKTIKGIRGTTLQLEDNGIGLYYHYTRVAYFLPNGEIIISNDGYKTRTTKERINQVIGNQAKVYQHKGEWYIWYVNGNTTHPFMDGMKV